MESINLKFYEAYKKLDQLCKQVLSSNYGVSEYIAKMENTVWQERQDVQSWNDDLKQLRHVRWIRTDLSHRPGSFEETVCTQDDIDWIHEFYIKLLNQTDPVSLLSHICSKKAIKFSFNSSALLEEVIITDTPSSCSSPFCFFNNKTVR